MSRHRRSPRLALALGAALALGGLPAALDARGAPGDPIQARVDAVFSKWTTTTPGCAVGVSQRGRAVIEAAYGMTDLEHGARNTPETIFEAGSVAKQFTAAAVLLLARDGKLTLDDPVRRYIPELPDYGAPLTIRHMLTHTSGLRDWGNIASIGGWPRTTRVYTHANVLDIVGRQKALNFTPGTYWSYSNTGYNLAAIIVARVSGMSFAEFTRQRIFQPLEMTHTSWRDDYTRVVKGRALAYSEARDGFHLAMPFENAHGNGGLLTTVGDLLRWNENFGQPKVGDAALVRELQEPARLSDGRRLYYALGLSRQTYGGSSEIAHSGSTAGYRAYLSRFPEQQLSVAVLCNVDTAAARQYARAVADLYLRTGAATPPPEPVRVSAPDLDKRAGLWRNVATGAVLTLTREENALKSGNGQVLSPVSPTRFNAVGGGPTIEFESADHLVLSGGEGLAERYERVTAVTPTAEQLRELGGIFVSDEAEVGLRVMPVKNELRMYRWPDGAWTLTPLYADAFACPLGVVRFHRDKDGRVFEMSLIDDRVWDLRFRKQ